MLTEKETDYCNKSLKKIYYSLNNIMKDTVPVEPIGDVLPSDFKEQVPELSKKLSKKEKAAQK